MPSLVSRPPRGGSSSSSEQDIDELDDFDLDSCIYDSSVTDSAASIECEFLLMAEDRTVESEDEESQDPLIVILDQNELEMRALLMITGEKLGKSHGGLDSWVAAVASKFKAIGILEPIDVIRRWLDTSTKTSIISRGK
jgi:hypothetical protein